MNRISRWLGIVALASLTLAGCSTDPTDVSPKTEGMLVPAIAPTPSFVSEETTINNYVVRFDGRTVSGGNTTFTYNVRGTGVDPALSHFTVELPPCAGAPSSYSPTGSANINTNPQTGIYGIEWHLSVAKDDFAGQTYSITFPGDVPLGIVRAEVKTGGGTSGVDYVYGPCSGFHISGSVFVDANNDGVRSPSEGGITNVTVAVTDGAATISALTDPTGNYSFVVMAGTYTVSVDAATAASDFNEDLFANFTVISPASQVVAVGPDAPNTNFAFEPKAGKVIADLESGLLDSAGRSVRYWKSQLRPALTGKDASNYTAAQLLAFVQQVETLGIATPFQFGAGTEIQEAMAILADGGNDPIVKLRRELLASELNFVSGNSLIGEEDLHEVLIIYGEELLAQTPTPVSGSIMPMAAPAPSETEEAGDMFGTMNGSTGGGGTED